MKAIDNDPMFSKSMVFCAWTGFACIFFFIIGVVILGGMLPPLFNSAEPAAEFARKVSEQAFALPLGSAFMVLSFALFGTVESVGLYWHMVDLLWLFIFPLLYLLGT